MTVGKRNGNPVKQWKKEALRFRDREFAKIEQQQKKQESTGKEGLKSYYANQAFAAKHSELTKRRRKSASSQVKR